MTKENLCNSINYKEFNIEVEKMKSILDKIEKENEKLKYEKNEILNDKNQIEEKYNEILQTNFSTVQKKHDKILNNHNLNLSKDINNEKQMELQIGMLREEMEQMNIEKSKLKETMNEAINKCAAYVMKEKELKQKLQEKEKQIGNLQNSKSLLQQTFTDQVFALRLFFIKIK